MCLKKIISHICTLPFILTSLYAFIISLTCLCGFLICYVRLTTTIQKETDREILNEFSEYSRLLKLKDIDTVKTAIRLEIESEGINRTFFRIMSTDGDILFSSNMSWWGNIPVDTNILKYIDKNAVPVLKTIHIAHHHDKVRIGYGPIGKKLILQLGRYMKEDRQFLNIFRRTFRTSMIIAIVLSTFIGWFLVRRTLHGIENVTHTALQISKGQFDKRVHATSRIREIEELKTAFNNMLDLINELFRELKEITDDIAHDLRTPIARIRGVAEMSLITDNTIEEYKDMAANTIEECDRLLNMINTMLDIRETEAGTHKLKKEEINISEMLRDLCDLFEPIAEEKRISLVITAPTETYIHGDVPKIQRMLANLLDNAIKYSPPGSTVKITLNSNDKQAIITISDTGIGISDKEIPKIFNRFYRCDQSRSREKGSGLGLSLALAIAKAHRGNIEVTSQLGKGSIFTVSLPM
ncbi:MAG: HAMP domain-containing protein [Deltaproteobacteria bacterium]|nr:HAMP domain-containing protein [Deltaproteobacteria bacterium]